MPSRSTIANPDMRAICSGHLYQHGLRLAECRRQSPTWEEHVRPGMRLPDCVTRHTLSRCLSWVQPSMCSRSEHAQERFDAAS